jgi:hypothetical protein
MLSRGQRRAETTLVSIVEDVTGGDAPSQGLVIFDRYASPAFAATHSYVKITANHAGLRILMVGALTGPVQMSQFAGAPDANVVIDDPNLFANTSQWVDQRTFNYPETQFPGPAFAFAGNRVRPYRVQHGTCSQRGPVILTAASPLIWFPRPLYVPPDNEVLFIHQVAATVLDLSFVVEHPLRLPQAQEGA